MEDRDTSYMNDYSPGFEFKYQFRVPESSNGERTRWPVKTVIQEHYLWTGETLLGNIGGSLGMFIGFSFTGVSASLFENLILLWGYCRPTRKSRRVILPNSI